MRLLCAKKVERPMTGDSASQGKSPPFEKPPALGTAALAPSSPYLGHTGTAMLHRHYSHQTAKAKPCAALERPLRPVSPLRYIGPLPADSSRGDNKRGTGQGSLTDTCELANNESGKA